jgi:hypothetical protein
MLFETLYFNIKNTQYNIFKNKFFKKIEQKKEESISYIYQL